MDAEQAPSSHVARFYWVLPAVTTIAALIPIWSVQWIPLGDYPIHLARCFTLFHYGDVPLFQQKYLVLFQPIPNIAEEVIIPSLMHVTDVFTAGRLFISLSLVLFVFGVYLLDTQNTRRPSPFLLFAPFLFYANQFFWGTLNYMFALALFFIVLGLWLRWRNRFAISQYLVLLVLATTLYLSHLSGIVFLGISLAVVVLANRLEKRAWNPRELATLTLFLPPIFLYMVFMRGSGHIGEIQWASFGEKIVAIMPFLVHNTWIDAAVLALGATLVGIAICKRKTIRFEKSYLSISVLFAIAFLLCPRVLYTTSGVDTRFAIPAWIFFMLSLRIPAPPKLGRILLTTGLLIFAVRTACIIHDWSRTSDKIEAEVQMLGKIPEQSRIYPVFNYHQVAPSRELKVMEFVPCYATIARTAFTLSLVARIGQQPLVWRDTVDRETIPDDPARPDIDWNALKHRYEYFWTLGPTSGFEDKLAEYGTLIGRTPESELWKIGP